MRYFMALLRNPGLSDFWMCLIILTFCRNHNSSSQKLCSTNIAFSCGSIVVLSRLFFHHITHHKFLLTGIHPSF